MASSSKAADGQIITYQDPVEELYTLLNQYDFRKFKRQESGRQSTRTLHANVDQTAGSSKAQKAQVVRSPERPLGLASPEARTAAVISGRAKESPPPPPPRVNNTSISKPLSQSIHAASHTKQYQQQQQPAPVIREEKKKAEQRAPVTNPTTTVVPHTKERRQQPVPAIREEKKKAEPRAPVTNPTTTVAVRQPPNQTKPAAPPQRVWDGNGWTDPMESKDPKDARKEQTRLAFRHVLR